MERNLISIVVPCYNEADAIARTIGRIDSYLADRKLKGEIIIVDDGSTDKTAEEAKKTISRTPVKVLKEKHRGKGAAVKTGILNSSGNLVLFADADLSTDISFLGKFAEEIEKGFDIIIASRDMPESELRPPQPFFRRFIGFVCRSVVRAVIMRDFRDTQCGFKLFKAEAAKKIFSALKTEGFAFDIEALYLAKKMGFKTREIGVVWENSPKSKVNPLIDPVKFFIQIFLIKMRTALIHGSVYKGKGKRETEDGRKTKSS